jgi:hypothetical protein
VLQHRGWRGASSAIALAAALWCSAAAADPPSPPAEGESRFFDGEGGWVATVTAYDEALHVVRGGLSSTLRATCAVGPDEALCDATHGAWTDDDVDPATGLYCLCAPPTVYVPSEGGCVP